MRRGFKVFLSLGAGVCLLLSSLPPVVGSQGAGRGSLTGYVYEQDGSTPVPGAVVVVKNLTTGESLESSASTRSGVFRIEELSAGIYALGVRSERGSYNSQDVFGVEAGKTSRISIALDHYDASAAAAAAAIIKEQREKGEAYVGKVTSYTPETREAAIQIEIGLLQSEDRVHIKGAVTDFYQSAKALRAYGAKAKRVLSGYTALLTTSRPCQPGDFVYVVCPRGVPPFFLAPLGVAAIVAGAVPLAAIYEDEPVSQFKIKK